jgi:hypothetical protein
MLFHLMLFPSPISALAAHALRAALKAGFPYKSDRISAKTTCNEGILHGLVSIGETTLRTSDTGSTRTAARQINARFGGESGSA